MPASIVSPKPAAATAVIDFYGYLLTNVTAAEAVADLFACATTGVPATVAFLNAHSYNVACTDPSHATALRAADRLYADGSGVRLGARLIGHRLRDNVNGTDLFPMLCAEAARRGLSVYLLGAAPGVADAVADAMIERCPGLRVAGVRHGYFQPDEDTAVVEAINASGADLLFVAFGVPKQELWLERHRDTLQVPVRLSVGGLFDFYSGRIPRAPLWLRRSGLEWAWRLAQEPGRLWRRYVLGNPLFVARVAVAAMRRRLQGRGAAPGAEV